MAGAQPYIDKKINQRKVMLFSKKKSPESLAVKRILETYNMDKHVYEVTEIEARQDCNQVENYLQIICLSDRREVPQLFVNRKYIGGYHEVLRMHESGDLANVLNLAGACAR